MFTMPPLNPLLGRFKIYTDEPEINEQNIAKVIGETMRIHDMNAVREQFLYDYERGDQPILEREKKIRPEINNKIVDNSASEIVNIHLAYDFSNPLTYVRKTKSESPSGNMTASAIGSGEGPGDEEYVLLNQMMLSVSKPTKDVEMGRMMMCTGVGYKMVWPSRDADSFAPFEVPILDPRSTYVVYSNDAYRDPVLGVTYFIHQDGTYTFTAYSKDKFFRFDRDAEGNFAEPLVMPNVLGMVPIVEYELPDRQGVFEKAIPLLDAINGLDSDRLNDIMQHVQSILWMNNAELDKNAQDSMLSGQGVICTKSQDGKNANIEYISQVLDQSQVQTYADYLKSQVLQITATPSWQEASGGSTTGAMQLSNGWQCLELSAKIVEMMYDNAERRFLRLVKKCIERSGKDYGKLPQINVNDIDIKFNRNKTFDLVSKVNSLSTLIQCGVYGLDAINTVNLFTDPQVTWENSKDTMNGIQKKLREQQSGGDARAFKDEQGNGGANNTPKAKTSESLEPSKIAGVNE